LKIWALPDEASGRFPSGLAPLGPSD